MSYMPTILKQPIDLFHLYMIVQALGGMLEIQAKKWKEICVLMNFPESASAAFTLKKNYMKFLFAFECCFDRGGIDPALILAMENLEKNRVRTCRIRRDVQKTEEFSYQNICNGDSTVIHASEKDIKASYNEETTPVDHVCSAALKKNLSLPNYHLKEGSRLQTNIPTMFHRNVKKEKSARRKIKRLPEIERVYIGNGVAPIFKEGTMAHANEKEHSKTAVKSCSMTALDTLGEIPNLPEPLAPPSVEHIPESLSFKQVFCDIETTSLFMYTEIVQIAAVCGEEEFDQYILPLRQFDPGSSKVTGLTCDGRNLYHHGTAVRTLDLRSALERFLGWLDQLKPCILVGHNFKSFDYPRLYKAFSKFHLINSFHQIVVGFIDSFPLFKAIYPNLKNYKQETLVAELVGETYDAHNALGDVRSLQKLFSVSDRIPPNLLCEHSFTVAWYVQYHNYKTKCNKIAESFSQIVNEKILSKTTIDKIAVSGLELKDLKQVYRKGGTKVVTEVLKSRLTLSRSTVDKLIEFLANKSSVDEYIPGL
ncbi:uncharacterized protein LOC132745230 [Ruditapes philippinarum]|uniref:uncharacterized protein LOC132745230 n=1 Tax=Ruditapes philippinarum TaxID=129788 RepID=UPI00295C17EA|nr:uncharacterized protein LOC132745230 [Ruditapes philippinarum]